MANQSKKHIFEKKLLTFIITVAGLCIISTAGAADKHNTITLIRHHDIPFG